jgi:hypothetical protein
MLLFIKPKFDYQKIKFLQKIDRDFLLILHENFLKQNV